MDLNGIKSMVSMRERRDLAQWKAGSAWLAGGTWLFSEPQSDIDTLLDLTSVSWQPITIDDRGVTIAATCTFASLYGYAWPSDLVAMSIAEPSCRALLGSFKVWNVATIGGNICLALAAAPMVAFATALEGSVWIWMPDGGERRVMVQDFVVGAGRTVIGPGEVVRAIELPMHALRRRAVTRRASLTAGGRSAAFLIGTKGDDGFALTITAATPRPYRLMFDAPPSADTLLRTIDDVLPAAAYYDDLHGRPAWRRHVTRMLAEEIRADLVES